MSDTETIQLWLQQLDHPFKKELNDLRELIKSTYPPISERIKWNAPSYYTHVDVFTFNMSNKKEIRLVFHHPAVVQIQSPILEGDWKDRRLIYFRTVEEIAEKRSELERVILEMIQLAGQNR